MSAKRKQDGDAVLRRPQLNRQRLGEILVKAGVVDEDTIQRVIVRRYEVIPLRYEGERLWVVMLDSYNLAAIDDIRFIPGFSQITVVACVEADFKRYIRDHADRGH